MITILIGFGLGFAARHFSEPLVAKAKKFEEIVRKVLG